MEEIEQPPCLSSFTATGQFVTKCDRYLAANTICGGQAYGRRPRPRTSGVPFRSGLSRETPPYPTGPVTTRHSAKLAAKSHRQIHPRRSPKLHHKHGRYPKSEARDCRSTGQVPRPHRGGQVADIPFSPCLHEKSPKQNRRQSIPRLKSPHCQRQSKSEPKGSAKCCHFGFMITSA